MTPIEQWEHPHDSTSPSSIQSSAFPHSSPSSVQSSAFPHSSLSFPVSNSNLCSALQNRAPFPITATVSHHLSLSIFGYCSVHSHGSKRFTSQQCSLAPSISVSDHPSQNILTALAKRLFSVQYLHRTKCHKV